MFAFVSKQQHACSAQTGLKYLYKVDVEVRLIDHRHVTKPDLAGLFYQAISIFYKKGLP